jgi:hypothetical protein
MKSSLKFNGERETYPDWFRTLKVDLLQKGIWTIAIGAKLRPDILEAAFWHINENLAANVAILEEKNRVQQDRWDENNGKAYAAIISSLSDALQKRYMEEDDPNNSNAAWLLASIQNRYGGAYDPKMIALFLIQAGKAILPNVRFESWSADWESLQRKMGKTVETHQVTLLAELKVVLSKSGCTKVGERFHEAYTFAEMSNMTYTQTRDHMIKQDNLITTSSIFNPAEVSFGESNIKRVDEQQQQDYYEWNRRSGGRSITDRNSNHNRRYDRVYHDKDDRRDSLSDKRNNRDRSDSRDRGRDISRGRNSSRDRYDRKNNRDRSREKSCDREKDNRDRSNSQGSANSRVSRDSRDRSRDRNPVSQSREKERKKSDNICFNFLDYGECKRGDNCRYDHKEKIHKSTNSEFKQQWLQSFSLQIDSGAAKSITGDLQSLSGYKPFPEILYMYTITGSRIPILGMGTIGIIPTYYSPEADSGVISTKDLQRRGMMTIFPPGENAGVWIVDPTTGEIIIEGDKNYDIPSTRLSTLQPAGENTENIVMSADDIRKTHGYSFLDKEGDLDFETYKIHTAKSSLSIHDKTISFKVADLQRTYGFRSMPKMLGYSRSIDGFPVTEKEILKHFVKFPQYQLGHITRKSFTSKPTLHHTPLQIGDIVSTDCIKFADHGCGAGAVQLFLDKKTKYAVGIFTKGEGNAQQLSECVTNVKNFYQSYGHKVTIISGDSLPTYRSEVYETNINEQQSRRQESAPHEQQQNEVESFVRYVEEGITTMKSSASWVPLKLIVFLVMLWISLWNLEEGTTRGISRYEEFTKTRPAIDAGARPGTYGDCYIVNRQKDERPGGHFATAHGDVVMYLSPNQQTKDAHWFYKPATDRVVSRRSFERIAGIPPAWLKGKTDTGTVIDEDGNKWDFIRGPQQYDVWHLGATSQAIAADTVAKYPLPIGINITQPTDFSNIVANSITPLETQISTGLASKTSRSETTQGGESFQEVPTLADTPQEVLPFLPSPNTTKAEAVVLTDVAVEPIGSRTRSSGPSDNLSIKSATYGNASYHYNASSDGKNFFSDL